MVLIQLLLRALRLNVRIRPRLIALPAAALAAALGAASVAGAHPLHSILAAGAHLFADMGTLTNGGGPPNP